MNRTAFIYFILCFIIIHVFTVTFDQFYASFLNSTYFLKKKKILSDPNLRTVLYVLSSENYACIHEHH